MTWLELSVDVECEAAESVTELLARYGCNGGVVIEQPILPTADGTEYNYDLSRPVMLRTYLPQDEHGVEACKYIEQALWHFAQLRQVSPLRIRTLKEEDWANAWKEHYTIQRIGARTVIVPSWIEYDQQSDEIVLRLDPGMAFGTGLHPTTQLCLILLEQYAKPATDVLDLGCGSGILAIAAARHGAKTVLALDTDPIAVKVTGENVTLNGVGDVVTVAEGSLGAGSKLPHWLGYEAAEKQEAQTPPQELRPTPYHLIVANIIAPVLIALAQNLTEALVPGGVLISSGIIAERATDVAEAFAESGLTELEQRQEGDWVAFVHKRG